MTSKRILDVDSEDNVGNAAKKPKISYNDITCSSIENDSCSALSQMNGLNDQVAGKNFEFFPNARLSTNISHVSSNYAPATNPSDIQERFYAPKMSFDDRRFFSPRMHPFAPDHLLPQRALGMPFAATESLQNGGDKPFQFMPPNPNLFAGMYKPELGDFRGMVNSGNYNLEGFDQKLHLKNNISQNSVDMFHNRGHSLTLNRCLTPMNLQPFSNVRKVSANGRPMSEALNPQNQFMFNNPEGLYPTLSNGFKPTMGHLPYRFNPYNIPDNSNYKPQTSMQPSNGYLNLPNDRFLPARSFDRPHWNPERREFPNLPLAPGGFGGDPRLSNAPDVSGASSNPMKMIENFSASHFDSAFATDSNAKHPMDKRNLRGDATTQDCGNEMQTAPCNPKKSHNVELLLQDKRNHVDAETNSKIPATSEKKTKKNKKNGEQSRYEAWLREKKMLLDERLATLERLRFSFVAQNGYGRETKDAVQLEDALLRLKQEALEHETLAKTFEASKSRCPASANRISGAEKTNKPAKSTAVQHLNPAHANTVRSSSGHPTAHDAADALRSGQDRKTYQDHPAPKILEPPVNFSVSLNIPGWLPERDKSKSFSVERDGGGDGFKPSDALEVLNTPPEDCRAFGEKATRDFSKEATTDDVEFSANLLDPVVKDVDEFRVTPGWLLANQRSLRIDSCSSCCRPTGDASKKEDAVVEVLGRKLPCRLSFCSEECMETHREKRRLWERDKVATDRKEQRNDATGLPRKDAMNIFSRGSVPNKMPSSDVSSNKNTLQLQSRPDQREKKWTGVKYGSWCKILHSRKRQKKETVVSERKTSHVVHPIGVSRDVVDVRCCVLCKGVGDDDGNGPGRLIVGDIDKWVHANCSLWSSNVYEALDGTFVGSKSVSCSTCGFCGRGGATIACFLPSCGLKFHLRCAASLGVCFLESKVTYCRHHCPKNLLVSPMKDISIRRRVCVERKESQLVAKMLREEEPENFTLRLGNLIVHNIGHLPLQHIHTSKFNTINNIYPVGYRSTRLYWSFKRLHHRCQYLCTIEENGGVPLFRVKVEEKDEDDVTFESTDCTGVWMRVLEGLDALRRANGLARVFAEYISGEDMFGLNEPAIRRVIESLPGVELMENCRLKYGKSPLYIPPLAINPSGCIRSEPKPRTFFKRSHTLLSNFNAGSSAKSAWFGSGEFSITQYMKQFTATKSQRYRSLRTEWRNNVYLRRSNIQGLGLFAGRELEQFTMVIEYIGEIIRNEVAEIREKVYEQQNRGVYMFRLDENTVVDATMAGGPARYINHSCDPNCLTEVIPTEKGSKIVIIAKRKIHSGEELSYDYKFNLEDEKSKIPCLCGAIDCTKWMN